VKSATPIFLSLGVGAAMAGACAVCAVKPEAVASYLRRRYLRTPKLVRNFPFYSVVMKPWYPTYLRLVGVFGLLGVIIWCCAVVIELSK
jgi:hypothetical protein